MVRIVQRTDSPGATLNIFFAVRSPHLKFLVAKMESVQGFCTFPWHLETELQRLFEVVYYQ